MPGTEPTPSGPAPFDPGALEPVPDDGVRAVSVGLLLWAAAGLVLLTQRGALVERGAQWWLWSCGAGLLIGLGMLVFMRRRAAAYRRHRDPGRAEPGPAKPAAG